MGQLQVSVPATHQTPSENFQLMRLVARRMWVDGSGQWWKTEKRQDPWTGMILRQTKRVTRT